MLVENSTGWPRARAGARAGARADPARAAGTPPGGEKSGATTVHRKTWKTWENMGKNHWNIMVKFTQKWSFVEFHRKDMKISGT